MATENYKYTLGISERLAAKYGVPHILSMKAASPGMREILFDAAPTPLAESEPIVEIEEEPNGQARIARSPSEPTPPPPPPRGTAFTAGRSTWCPRCGKQIGPGDQAVMMNFVEPSTGRTKNMAFTLDCAIERGWVAP